MVEFFLLNFEPGVCNFSNNRNNTTHAPEEFAKT